MWNQHRVLQLFGNMHPNLAPFASRAYFNGSLRWMISDIREGPEGILAVMDIHTGQFELVKEWESLRDK